MLFLITLTEMLFKLNLYSLPSIISYSHIVICYDFFSSFLWLNFPFPTLPFRLLPFLSLPFASLPSTSLRFPSLPFLSLPFLSLPFRLLPSLVSDNEDALKSVLLRENVSLKAKIKVFEKNEMDNISRIKSPGHVEIIDAESDEVFLSVQLKRSQILLSIFSHILKYSRSVLSIKKPPTP